MKFFFPGTKFYIIVIAYQVIHDLLVVQELLVFLQVQVDHQIQHCLSVLQHLACLGDLEIPFFLLSLGILVILLCLEFQLGQVVLVDQFLPNHVKVKF